eukprot:8683112-Prorocentrum_lima.AAC.1
MTSSLVGSEMCIRDRSRADLSQSPGQGLSNSGHQNSQSSQTLARAHPVSYTHLTLPTICSV